MRLINKGLYPAMDEAVCGSQILLKQKPSLCKFNHFKVFFAFYCCFNTRDNQHKEHNIGSYMIIQTETAGLSPLCPFDHSYSLPFPRAH